MLKKSLKTRQEVEDFVRGCTFYGTGGGGDYASGVEVLMGQLEKGLEVGWIDPAELADDEYSICPFLMGSIAPHTPETIKEMKSFGLTEQKYDYKDMLARSVKALEKFTDTKVKALVPIELGGGNAAACISAAAENGIFTLDGDYTGRAIPEIQQTTPYIFEKSLLPITSSDGWGNTAIIEEAVNWHMAERIGKLISAAGYAACGQAGFLMNGKDTKEALIHGTMTECYELGKLIREEREAGNDPIEAVVKKLGGWVLCKGTVTEKEWEDRVGYYWGYHTITGENDFEGTNLKIWFKNENHVCWKNGEVYVTSPDMIIVVDLKTCEPYTNNKIEEGLEVAVIGLKARDVFRRPRGIDVLGPKAFGFEIEYVPIEVRMSENNPDK
jgi:DUF917 family protein